MEKSGPASVYTKHRTIIKNSDYHIYFASDKWINCPSLSNCRAIAKLTFLPALCFLCTFLFFFFFFLNLRQHSDSDSHCRGARETSKQESLSGYFPMAMLQLELDSLRICCFWLRTTKENNQSSYAFVINGGSPGKCSDSYHYCPSAGHMHTLSTVCEHNSFRLFSFHTWS